MGRCKGEREGAKKPNEVMLFDPLLVGGVTGEAEGIRLRHSLPTSARIALDVILVILTLLKKHSSKIFLQVTLLQASERLNN